MNVSRILNTSARVVKGFARIIPTDPTRKALTLTPEAVQRVKELLSQRPDSSALKVGFLIPLPWW